MRKKTIYAVLMTVLVTSFTGCGQKEDTNAVDVVVSEAETQDPDLTAEAQALWTPYCRRRLKSR